MPEVWGGPGPSHGKARIVIIGGGFTGAAVAHRLVRIGADADIVVIEPRAKLGQGLAYSTAEPSHRVNVAAARMSLDPDRPDHFVEWLHATGAVETDPDMAAPTGDLFPQRRHYGDYVAAQLAPLVASGAIRHLQTKVNSVDRIGSAYTLQLAQGDALAADVVVVATTHPLPCLPMGLEHVAGNVRLVANPYDLAAIDAIPADNRVLIVGSGLTSADVIAMLDRRGHSGPIVALSRHGHRSRGHAKVVHPPEGEFVSPDCATARGLVERVRRAIRDAELHGRSWHPVFEGLRRQGQSIWRGLALAERRRIVRHLRSIWDVHRFRIAPQTEQVLEDRLRSGNLHYIAGRLLDCDRADDGFSVTWRKRGAKQLSQLGVDTIIVTTGPSHRCVLDADKPLAGLARSGHLRLDAVGLGLATDAPGRALDRNDRPVGGLYVAGPLARGAVGELMGVAEVGAHARGVAEIVAVSLPAQLKIAAE